MFTGLVQQLGTIRSVSPGHQSRRLLVEAELDEVARVIGASVAVDGVCLTVTGSNASSFTADAAFETLRATTLGHKAAGDLVNVEPALRLGDPLGGHLVSGHVDGIGTLVRVEERGEARACRFELEPRLARFVADKGSICVSGVSLTVNVAHDRSFDVGIVPHTLSATTLGQLSVGARVNLEVDLLARYVDRLLTRSSAAGGVSLEQLAAAGYCQPTER
ncbi:MAG: riboflavin synthase [Myxococcales bacterium FL481]|nr:MAG: riboflavin synthase [Myxococcales bacterium FL481]